jgi:fructose-1,6-bisphosphatase/inositol monophosphatase family enzyme
MTANVAPFVDGDELLGVLHRGADAVAYALGGLADWGLAGTVPGQHRSDLAADEAARSVLVGAGLSVLSEESGLTPGGGDVTVVLDPLDGSTNAHRGLAWYATSLCAVDLDGPVASLVVDQAGGDRYEAVRGDGARRNGQPVEPSAVTELGESFVGVSGSPPRPLGWRQYRALGAAALDLCLVGCGRLDGYVDCSVDAHGVWDYAGALLFCREAGAAMVDAQARDLVVLDHGARRTPVAAGTGELLDALVRARREAFGSR